MDQPLNQCAATGAGVHGTGLAQWPWLASRGVRLMLRPESNLWWQGALAATLSYSLEFSGECLGGFSRRKHKLTFGTEHDAQALDGGRDWRKRWHTHLGVKISGGSEIFHDVPFTLFGGRVNQDRRPEKEKKRTSGARLF